MFGTIATVAGPVLGGLISANAAGNAADQQTSSTGQAVGESRRQFDTSRSDLAPYRNLGQSATTRIGQLLGLSSGIDQNDPRYQSILQNIIKAQDDAHTAQYGFSIFDPRSGLSAGRSQFDDANQKAATNEYIKQYGQPAAPSASDIMAQDPGYQFRLNQGSRALTNAAGASGMLNSGATAKALTRYGQDYASNEFGSVYNRLANAAGMGQGAVNTGVNAGANTAGTVGNLLTAGGNARGAAAIAGGNALGGALGTIGSYYGQQNTLDKILNSRGGQGYTPGYFATYGGT